MGDSLSLYYYLTHSKQARPIGYSLYSVGISLPGKDKGCEVKQPQLAVHFPLSRRYDMVCGKLGSKFYFLGGFTIPDEGKGFARFLKGAAFPTDVMVYDPTDPDNSDKEPAYRVTWGKPMNFGKSRPITFEVNGKLYVLGESHPFGQHKRLENLFEEYDPIKNCWKLLEGPPLEEIPSDFLKVGQSFVVSSNKVLITCNSSVTILSFDPLNYKWTKLFRRGGLDIRSIFAEDSFYGVWLDGTAVTKLGPCSSFEDGKEIEAPYTELPIEWGCFSPFLSRHYMDPSKTTNAICHLGGRIFRAMATGYAGSDYPFVPDNTPYLHRSVLKLIIYEEIRGDPLCSKLKFLQHSSFSIPTQFSGFPCLTCCYAMTHEEKDKRIQVDEKKIETNLEEKKKKKKKKKKNKKKTN